MPKQNQTRPQGVPARTKFTAAFLEALPPAAQGTRYAVSDEVVPGMKVRVTDRGTKTLILWMRRPGQENLSARALGEVGKVKLADAREQARGWLAALAAKQDPAVLAREAKAAEDAKAACTFEVAWTRYEAQISHQRSADKVRQIFNAELLPVFKNKPLHELKRADVKDMVRKIARRSSHQAFAAFGNLRTFLNWCRDEGDYGLEAVCTDGTRAHKIVGKKKVHRKRVLTDDELFSFWRATRPERWRKITAEPLRRIRGKEQRVKILYPDRTASMAACRTLLLTGARLNEICEADRRELNPEATTLTVAAERFKSDEAHMIPLSPDAQAIIAEQPRRKTPFLFSDDGKTPVRIWNKDRRRMDRRMLLTLKALAKKRGQDPDAVTLPPFVLHDLRRTMRTRLAALKVPSEIAEMAIGHGQRGLLRVYDQHQYQEEIRSAVTAWAALLMRIVSKPAQGQVIDIAARRA